jgi:hypothetical protein
MLKLRKKLIRFYQTITASCIIKGFVKARYTPATVLELTKKNKKHFIQLRKAIKNIDALQKEIGRQKLVIAAAKEVIETHAPTLKKLADNGD